MIRSTWTSGNPLSDRLQFTPPSVDLATRTAALAAATDVANIVWLSKYVTLCIDDWNPGTTELKLTSVQVVPALLVNSTCPALAGTPICCKSRGLTPRPCAEGLKVTFAGM